MSRARAKTSERLPRFPRTRGDEPSLPRFDDKAFVFSPHTRG